MTLVSLKADGIEWQAHRFQAQDRIVVTLDQFANASAGEETKMGGIKDSPLVVVEHAQYRPQTGIPVGNVRNADERCAVRGQHSANLLEQVTRPRKMFQHISGEHQIKAGAHVRRDTLIEIGLEEGTSPFANTLELVDIHTCDVVSHLAKPLCQETAGTAEIQDLARRP